MNETPLQRSDESTEQRPSATDAERVEEQILRALGRPPGLCSVQVRPLWENRFRVNIFAGGDLLSAKITDSFFVVTGSNSRIAHTAPPVTRRY
jgi:hypothetical protein